MADIIKLVDALTGLAFVIVMGLAVWGWFFRRDRYRSALPDFIRPRTSARNRKHARAIED